MDSADGIEVNTTVIKVLSVDVGRVTRIRLRDDRKGVEVTVRLNADAKTYDAQRHPALGSETAHRPKRRFRPKHAGFRLVYRLYSRPVR